MDNLNKTRDLKKLASIKDKIKKSNMNNISIIQKEIKLFEKTFTNGLGKNKFHKIKDYKDLNKSQSGILLKNKKFPLFEDLYVHNENEIYNNNIIYWGKNYFGNENKNKSNHHIINIKMNQKIYFYKN